MALMNLGTVNGVPVLKGMLPDDSEVASYIVSAAQKRGIDPKTALTVWSHEGRGAWQSHYMKNGQREASFGPFQLYKGGGLGNRMQKDTGLDPADPKNWRQSVDYALDYAAAHGWGEWFGAKRAGVTGMMGIGGAPAATAGVATGQVPAPQSAPTGLAQSPMQAQAPAQTGNNVGTAISNAFKRPDRSFGPLPTTSMMGGLTPDQMEVINGVYKS